jgi:5-formyltetrahydrofolate cyclo-ligase
VGCYLAYGSELSTERVIEAIWRLNKICYLPLVDKKQPGKMAFIEYKQHDLLEKNRFNIQEPKIDKARKTIIPTANGFYTKCRVASCRSVAHIKENSERRQQNGKFICEGDRSETLDLVLVPLIAFDRVGNRLGSGHGYYDQAFQFLIQAGGCKLNRPILCGLAYSIQYVPKIPCLSTDVPLDIVITEKGIIYFD